MPLVVSARDMCMRWASPDAWQLVQLNRGKWVEAVYTNAWVCDDAVNACAGRLEGQIFFYGKIIKDYFLKDV